MSKAGTSLLRWEDVEVGKTYSYGAYPVTRDEIFAFAHAYDPQPHHVDEAAAMKSLVRGLCASGWHTCAMFMRLYYDGWLCNYASAGAAGIDEVRWLKPVRPGFVLSARSVCMDKRVMRSRPEIGICRMRHEVRNQSDEVLLTMENAQFIRVRDTKAAAAGAGSAP